MTRYDRSFTTARDRAFEPLLNWTVDQLHAITPEGWSFNKAIIGLSPTPLRTVGIVIIYDDMFYCDSLPGLFVNDNDGLGHYAVSAYREINANYHAELLECLFRKYPFLASAQLQSEDTRYDFYELAGQEDTSEAVDVKLFSDAYLEKCLELAECLRIYINTHFGESL